MRILLITDWLRLHGGAEAHFAALRAGLRAAGDDVALLTSDAGSAAKGSAEFVAFASERIAAQVVLQLVNPFAVATVRRAVASFRPDVACVGMFALHLSPAAVGALGDVPAVLAVSDYKCVCPMGSKLLPSGKLCTEHAGWVCRASGCVSIAHWLRDVPRYALIQRAVGRFRRIVACSAAVRDELARAGIAADHVVWPVPEPISRVARNPAPDPLFVFVGRLDVEKGVEALLRAFARVRSSIPRAQLRFVGRGPLQPRLEQLARSSGIASAVTFTGWLDPDAVGAQLVDAWALVAPSAWAEPFGFVAVEAIARAVPVIASAGGGFGETIEHGVSGLLFANGDEDALTACMLEVAQGRAFADHVLPSELARRVAAKHDMQVHVARMRAILASVLT